MSSRDPVCGPWRKRCFFCFLRSSYKVVCCADTRIQNLMRVICKEHRFFFFFTVKSQPCVLACESNGRHTWKVYSYATPKTYRCVWPLPGNTYLVWARGLSESPLVELNCCPRPPAIGCLFHLPAQLQSFSTHQPKKKTTTTARIKRHLPA